MSAYRPEFEAALRLFTRTPIWPIWNAAFGKRVLAIMASKMSKAEDEGPVINMAELGARIAERKAGLGLPDLPRNEGKNRTVSKKALMKAIRHAGGEW